MNLWEPGGSRFKASQTKASELLAPIYSWFPEGVGTPDWEEAKALLTALT